MRLQRVSPEMPLNYYDKRASKSWTIPAGTPVSMDALSIHMHQDYFPEPDKFLPERWIENPKLERYSFGFSRGSRMCLGYALFYMAEIVKTDYFAGLIWLTKSCILSSPVCFGNMISTMAPESSRARR